MFTSIFDIWTLNADKKTNFYHFSTNLQKLFGKHVRTTLVYSFKIWGIFRRFIIILLVGFFLYSPCTTTISATPISYAFNNFNYLEKGNPIFTTTTSSTNTTINSSHIYDDFNIYIQLKLKFSNSNKTLIFLLYLTVFFYSIGRPGTDHCPNVSGDDAVHCQLAIYRIWRYVERFIRPPTDSENPRHGLACGRGHLSSNDFWWGYTFSIIKKDQTIGL